MPSSGEQTGQKERLRNPFEMLLNMRREVPEFTRCCFCLPLRRGLISWGYIKLAINTAAIWILMYIQVIISRLVMYILIELGFLFIDAAFCIVLIVGGHQKNSHVLKSAYIYNIVWLGLLVLSYCWNTYLEIRMALGLMLFNNVRFETIMWVSVPGLCVNFSLIFVQIYMILLIRSEVLKLEEQSLEMEFTNPSAAEAQCTMHVSSGGQAMDVSTGVYRSDAVECTTSDNGFKASG